MHTERILRLSLDLPIVVEVVETEEKIQQALPELDGLIGGGLVTLEKVRVILYRPGDVPETSARCTASKAWSPTTAGRSHPARRHSRSTLPQVWERVVSCCGG